MASEYNLKLKATLDTKQVQQELNKLKQLQIDGLASANYGSGKSGSNPVGSLANMNALMSKFDNIASQLSKCTQVLQQVAQSFNLNSAANKTIQTKFDISGQRSSQMPFAATPLYGNSLALGKLRFDDSMPFNKQLDIIRNRKIFVDLGKSLITTKPDSHERKSALHDFIEKVKSNPSSMGFFDKLFNIIDNIRLGRIVAEKAIAQFERMHPGMPKLSAELKNPMIRQIMMEYTAQKLEADMKKLFYSPEGREMINYYSGGQEKQMRQQKALIAGMKAFNKSLGMMAGSQGLHTLGIALDNFGYKKAGKILDYSGQIVGGVGAGAATGYAFGNAPGAAVGAGIGLVFSTFKVASEIFANAQLKIKDLADSIKELRKVSEISTKYVRDFVLTTRFEDFKSSLKNGSVESLTALKARKQTALDDAKRERTALASQFDQEVRDKMVDYEVEKSTIDTSTKEGLQQLYEVLKKYSSEVLDMAKKAEAITDKIEKILKEYDAVEKQLAEKEAKAKEERAKTEKIEKITKSIASAELTRILLKTGGASEIQAELASVEKLRDSARAAKDPELFAEYANKAQTYKQALESIKERQEEAKLQLSMRDESFANLQSDDVYGGMLKYSDLAKKHRAEYEMLIEEGNFFKAAKAKQSWDFAAGERDMFAGKAQDLLTGHAPDLTNVTSLASMGFNMGEKNDNVMRQQNFWNETLELLRLIRTILNDKLDDNNATYE